MSYTTIPSPNPPTDLTKQISEFSLVGTSGPIEEMGLPINQEGTSEWNRGLSTGQANPLPFDAPNNIGKEGHLVDLLTKDTESSRLNASSPAQSPQWLGGDATSDLDMEGDDLGVNSGPQVFTQGLGQNDGKKVNGKDLHVELLQGDYNYSHGPAGPWSSQATITASPNNSVLQDLTPDHVTGPLGSPADLKPGWNYIDAGPQTIFNS